MHKIEVQALESMQRDEKTKQEKKNANIKISFLSTANIRFEYDIL